MIDKLLERVPLLGKILVSIFGFQEWTMLKITQMIEKRFKTKTLAALSRYILKNRWGGKVVPLNKTINSEVRFLPSQEIIEILSRSNVTGISNCYCRETQRRYDIPNCSHPVNTCIHIGTGKSLYDIPYKSNNLKKVSKQKVIDLLQKCDKEGLVHQLIYYPNPNFYYVVCNCCPCCCIILRNFLDNGSPQMVESDFIADTDSKKCLNCGKCVEWCYFGGRVYSNNHLEFNPENCFGCGICVSKCPQKAISLRLKTSS
ncbi:MAG: hypothetical protein EU533_07605 [Promethearchaeota archaeon]|nr:MAG: hypothetical protein EU533_07605 [Candidatus Lokiarchaeota archaeon]